MVTIIGANHLVIVQIMN